jgi:CubicO group peptidase (beta-lactamase class C family)
MPAQIRTGTVIFLILLLLTGCSAAGHEALTPTIPLPTPLLTDDPSIREVDGMVMAWIQGGVPPGGSNPIEGFWFDRSQVTMDQFLGCVQAGTCEVSSACHFPEPAEATSGTLNDQLLCARWSDTKAYCEWAGGRLPAEAEWELAAQQTGEQLSPWGNPQTGFRCLVPSVRPAEYWPTQGWITSRPEEQGLDPDRLAAGVQKMWGAFTGIHSLLIVRHGFLVVEEYRASYGPGVYQDIASVNKSFLSALVGIAIEQGAIPGLDQKMMDYFPGYSPAEVDSQAYAVTIEDLLTMTSGFYWPEDEPVSPAYIDAAFLSGKPQDVLLRSPIDGKPGTAFNYCTACTHVLSIILQDATGMPAQEFAQKFLMDPLGIAPDDWYWDRTAYGYNTGGWAFSLNPRDMARFGYLYLHNGNWDGQQVVPEEWVRESRQAHIRLGKSNTAPYQSLGYGYLWWTTNLGGHPAYYALGHGGQYIYILPTMDMIVVITQRTDSHNGGDPFEIIRDYFAAAVLDP